MSGMHIRPATKAEWVRIKKEIQVSREGLKLLEYKRDILMAEGIRLLKQSKPLRATLGAKMTEIDRQWKTALTHQHFEQIAHLAKDYPEQDFVDAVFKRWMSVDVVNLTYNAQTPRLLASAAQLEIRVEQVRGTLNQLIAPLIQLMAMETNIRRIALALKRSNRQVNSLTRVVIPELQDDKKRIEQRLEEKERESIFQVKLLKARQL